MSQEAHATDAAIKNHLRDLLRTHKFFFGMIMFSFIWQPRREWFAVMGDHRRRVLTDSLPSLLFLPGSSRYGGALTEAERALLTQD